MVGLNEVSEFVHDDIVYDEHWGLYQPPIEINIVLDGARAPAVPIVNDLGGREFYSEIAGVLFHAAKNLFFGARNVPIP